MPVYALGDVEPTIHPEAFVHPDATVIGDVTLAAGVSVWPQAVLRGDYGSITVGERTSVQDGTVLHCTEWHPTVIGADCVLGHNTHVEGAGAVVSFNGVVPAHRMALGVPARVREGYEVPEGQTQGIVDKYVQNITRYKGRLRRL